MFWPYHDTLFLNQAGENRGAFREPALMAFADALSLDVEDFGACLESGRYRSVVMEDLEKGRLLGVRSTPTLFINGTKIEGALPFEAFQQIIEAELDQ